MKRSTKLVTYLLTGCLLLTAAGCQTYGEGAGLGAALGGTAGAIIGHQSGHALEGAAIGAVIGGLGGLIAHDIKARKAKARAETVETYNYQPQQGEMLSYERSEILPNVVRPGEMFTSTVQYALLGAGAGVQVTESRQLLQGDRVIADVSTKNFTRDDGTWVSEQQIRLPNDAASGEYTIVTRVSTAQSSISGRAPFTVGNMQTTPALQGATPQG